MTQNVFAHRILTPNPSAKIGAPLTELNHDLVLVCLTVLAGICLILGFRWRAAHTRYRHLQTEHRQLEAQLSEQARVGEELKASVHQSDIQAESIKARFEAQSQALVKSQEDNQTLQHKVSDSLETIESLRLERTQISTQLAERERAHELAVQQFEQQRQALKQEFENLSNRIFEEKGKVFSEQNKHSIESVLKPLRDQLGEFRARVDTVQKEHSESQGSLLKELEQLRQLNQSMSEDAQNLTQALKGDKKKLGNWGEIQVEKTLEYAGLVKGDHYHVQASFKDEAGKTRLPDFIIRLPDEKHLILDSKVSLVAFDQAMSAEDDAGQIQALKAHTQAVKAHIDALSEKDYAHLHGINSPSFVLMFMPIEAAYIEVLRGQNDLFNYGYAKGVVMVSHTTLMPILRTVANLWMIEKSTQEVQALGDTASDVYKQVCVVAERIGKLGHSLNAATNHYNDSVTALSGNRGLYAKVERFSKISTKVNRELPALKTLESHSEVQRLDVTKDDN